MPIISDIAIRIRAITQPFTSALEKAKGFVGSFMDTIGKIAAPIIAAFKAIGGAVLKLISLPFKLLSSTLGKIGALFTAVAGGGIALFIKKQFDLIDAMAKTSRALKVNIDFLEGLKLAGSQLGVSNEKIIKSLKKFTRTMGEAKLATGAGATVFRVWGKSVEDFQNLNVEESFLAIANELKKIKDPTKQAAIAFQFFGRNGIEMLNIINANKAAIEEFLKESKRLKGAFDPVDAAKVEAANDAIDKMKVSLEGIGKEISFILAPLVKFFADKLTGAFVKARITLENFRQTIEKSIINTFKMLAPIVLQAANAISAIWTKLTNFLGGPNGLKWINQFNDALFNALATIEFVAKQGMNFWRIMGDGMVLAIRFSLKEMAMALQKFLDKWMKMQTSALTGVLGLLGNFRKVAEGELSLKEFARDAQEFARGASKGFKDLVKFLNPTQKELAMLGKRLKALNDARLEFIKGRRKDVEAETKALVMQLENLFKGATEGVGDQLQNEIDETTASIKLEPKLALRGSQEAARISAGINTTNKQIEKNTNKTARNTDATAKALKEILRRMLGTSPDDGVNVFDPAVTGGAVGAGGIL